jgi:hypothetical protein
MWIATASSTVGDTGRAAMPGELPPASGYTYAVALTADEALAAGAESVTFSQPLPLYVDNFLGFPTGMAVPPGAYDPSVGAWIPEPNGKVMAVLSTAGGVATLDTNGDGQANDAAMLAALGITVAEQQALAARTTAGQQLWRLVTRYFSAWDANWPYGPPADAVLPNGPRVGLGGFDGDQDTLDAPDATGALAIQNQALSQAIDPLDTRYRIRSGNRVAPAERQLRGERAAAPAARLRRRKAPTRRSGAARRPG